MAFASKIFRRSASPPKSTAPFALPDLHAPRCAEGTTQVGVLVYQGVTTAEIDEPVRRLAAGLDADVVYISASTQPVVGVEPVRTVHINATTADPVALHSDVLVIPGGLGWERLVHDIATITWVMQAAKAAQGILAISTGSLILASAGQLDGHAATGHWLAHDTLSALGADVHEGRTAQSEDHRTVTATGAQSAIDAAAELAERIRWGPA